MRTKVKSEKGFYFGDPCYVLDDELYYGVWGNVYEFQDCSVRDPKTGLHFSVAGTYMGDGTYGGSNGRYFSVDSGTLALIPLEMIHKELDDESDYTVSCCGEAVFKANDGVFRVVFPDGSILNVDTAKGWKDYGW